jgi:hypothetical protein
MGTDKDARIGCIVGTGRRKAGEISRRRGGLIVGDAPEIRSTLTALLPRSFQHPAASEVRALACGEIDRWVSRRLYKTENKD